MILSSPAPHPHLHGLARVLRAILQGRDFGRTRRMLTPGSVCERSQAAVQNKWFGESVKLIRAVRPEPRTPRP
jgi:hypothetical protein